jgi:hypothetical protein
MRKARECLFEVLKTIDYSGFACKASKTAIEKMVVASYFNKHLPDTVLHGAAL